MSASSTDIGLDQVEIAKSAVAGAVAWVVSYVVVLILVAATEDGGDLVHGSGNILYGAHFVKSKSKASAMGMSQTKMVNAAKEASLSEFVYYAVPIIVLLVVAVALVRYLEVPDEIDATVAGAAMAVGYLLLTAVGTFVFEISRSQQGASVTVSPELGLMTILLMGLVYPVVLGAVGGYAGSQMAE